MSGMFWSDVKPLSGEMKYSDLSWDDEVPLTFNQTEAVGAQPHFDGLVTGGAARLFFASVRATQSSVHWLTAERPIRRLQHWIYDGHR